MRRLSLRAITTAVVGALVVSVGLVGGGPTVASATPTVSADALSPSLLPASGARLWVGLVHPLIENDIASISVDFASANTYKSRWVSVQYEKNPGDWRSLKVAKMDKSGKLTAKVAKSYAAALFRAVALVGTYKKKAYPLAATPSVRATTKWTNTLSEGFDAEPLNSTWWSTRSDGTYHGVAGSRQCSAANPDNANIRYGKLSLAMKKLGSTTTESKERQAAVAIAKRDAAIDSATKTLNALKAKNASKAKVKAAEKKLKSARAMSQTKGCPQGVFSNATIGTEGKFFLKSGIIAASIKFPKSKGMHGSAWLQSSDGQEIDFIESYGLGKGITNVIHDRKGSKLVRYPSTAAKSYVLKSTVKKSSWWSKYHVFSLEFDSKQLIFRVDGKVTKTMKGMDDRSYFLVLSLLSSDWELPLLNSSKTSVMSVDWVKIWEKKAA